MVSDSEEYYKTQEKATKQSYHHENIFFNDDTRNHLLAVKVT